MAIKRPSEILSEEVDMAKYIKSGVSKQIVWYSYFNTVICLFLAFILSAGILAGCGSPGNDSEEPLNGIDSTESSN